MRCESGFTSHLFFCQSRENLFFEEVRDFARSERIYFLPRGAVTRFAIATTALKRLRGEVSLDCPAFPASSARKLNHVDDGDDQ